MGALFGGFAGQGIAADPPGGESPILYQMKQFKELGSILMVAAHPDDENTQLITYAARGPGYRMAYLSLTRGDGGQNLLGPEFGPELGLIRTEELLAARRLDGGQQFFTRAIDFGYSKTPEETLKIWDRKEVLGDVVRVIRTFRPDVMVTVFSPTAGNTHGHHTASAILAVEAFKLAGDAKAYPEQLAGPGALNVWQPKRVVMNSRGGPAAAGAMRMDIGGTDPVSGVAFGDIATQSRAMHKTQGFGQTPAGGARGGGGGGPNVQSFTLLDGAPAGANGIFDGVDTTWARVEGGAEIGKLADDVIAKFDAKDPAANVPGILEMRKKLAALPHDRMLDEKRRQLDGILQACLGLVVETTVANAQVVPGEQIKMKHTVTMSAAIPARWSVTYPNEPADRDPMWHDLKPGERSALDTSATLSPTTKVSQPYWLREEPGAGIFKVADPSLIGRPENPPPFPVDFSIEIAGQTLHVMDEPVQVITAAGKPDIRRRLDVIAAVSMAFKNEVRVFAPGSERAVEVELTGYRANAAGTLQLDVPAGWKTSAAQPFKLSAVGDHAKFTFNVTAPAKSATGDIVAHARIGDQDFTTARKEIDYPHIPPLLMQPPAVCKAVSLDLAIAGKKVAYLPGAGDSVAPCLEQMGYEVTQIAGADLTPEKLKGFDAVVVGIRAMNTRTDLAANEQGLFDYAAAGGTVVVQYNQPGGLKAKLAPYNLTLSGDLPRNRVDEEDAKVTLLVPDHPAFNTPNKIGAADWEGWVQERGLNFPSDWDAAHFTALLACSDTGEAPLKGGLLVADIGKGHFVYTGLAFFRQLPAGVPGAYRLFANLVSLGK